MYSEEPLRIDSMISAQRLAGFSFLTRKMGDTEYRWRVNVFGTHEWGSGNGGLHMAMSGSTVGHLGGRVLELSRIGTIGIDLNDGFDAISLNAQNGQFKIISETYGTELLRILSGALSNGSLIQNVPTSPPADADFKPGQACFWLDANTSDLKVKVKFPDGVVKHGSLSLV